MNLLVKEMLYPTRGAGWNNIYQQVLRDCVWVDSGKTRLECKTRGGDIDTGTLSWATELN